MESEGTTSQPLGIDVIGALMARIDALGREMKSASDALARKVVENNDAFIRDMKNDRDAFRRDMIRIKTRVHRLGPPKSPQNSNHQVPNSLDQRLPSQVQTPQVQRSYTSQNPMNPLQELKTKESESKPQYGEKINGEVQEECEERREKEGETMGSEVGREKMLDYGSCPQRTLVIH